MQLLIDYYSGAYGPTIRFDTISKPSIQAIRQIFEDLVLGKAVQYALQDMPGVDIRNISRFTIRVTQSRLEAGLRVLDEESGGRVVEWLNTKEGWDECCGLLDGLINSKGPGHQYLTDEGAAHVVVEFCFLERPESTNSPDS